MKSARRVVRKAKAAASVAARFKRRFGKDAMSDVHKDRDRQSWDYGPNSRAGRRAARSGEVLRAVQGKKPLKGRKPAAPKKVKKSKSWGAYQTKLSRSRSGSED